MFRKVLRHTLPGSANNIGSQSASMLITLSDFPDGFDDKQVLDVCISVAGGGGSAHRVLSRQRQTLRAAVQQAGVLAEQLAQAGGETIVAPGKRPSIAHLADGQGGCMLALDYDLGPRGQARPRVVRSLRLFVVGRHESSDAPHPDASARAKPIAASSRSRVPPS